MRFLRNSSCAICNYPAYWRQEKGAERLIGFIRWEGGNIFSVNSVFLLLRLCRWRNAVIRMREKRLLRFIRRLWRCISMNYWRLRDGIPAEEWKKSGWPEWLRLLTRLNRMYRVMIRVLSIGKLRRNAINWWWILTQKNIRKLSIV